MSENSISLDKTETVGEIRALLAPTYSVENSLAENYRALQTDNHSLLIQRNELEGEVARLKEQLDVVTKDREVTANAALKIAEQRDVARRTLSSFKEQVAGVLVEHESDDNLDGDTVESILDALGLERPTKEVEFRMTVTITGTVTVASNVDVEDVLQGLGVHSDGEITYDGPGELDSSYADVSETEEN